jgi:hypothetical protein
MKTSNIHTTLAEFYNCKKHDFLYIVKDVSTKEFLPKLSKSAVKDMIKSTGLYHITYRLYKNKEGYESLFVSKAAKVLTK